MNLNDDFVICTLKTSDEIIDAFMQFKSYDFLHALENMEECRRRADKLAKYGVFFAAYLDNELLGFFTGYANNHETKCAFGHTLAISREAGLLRGVIWKKLFYSFMTYAKSQGMEYCTGQVEDQNTYAKGQYLSLGGEVIDRNDEESYEWIKFNIQEVLDKLDSTERHG